MGKALTSDAVRPIVAAPKLAVKCEGRRGRRPHAGLLHGVFYRLVFVMGSMLTLSVADARVVSDKWWQGAIVYEIYPRSFQDSNGDGVGDINGITSRLSYLQDLGVDAIWIAPFFPAPGVDFGYDISDYRSVDPIYGTLADFDRLVREARARHIRVIIDMVLNHTSNQHPWFIEASRSAGSPMHDYYIWSAARKGDGAVPQPPNNWQSQFGGSAWQWVPTLNQFYYHAYFKEQPDLNWRNPKVEQAMFDVMRFWLDRGVAGFRLDAITELLEDSELRDEPPVGGVTVFGDPKLDHRYTTNLPETHAIIRRMRAMVSSYPGDRVLIGETYLPNVEELDRWYGGAQHDELQLPMDLRVGFANKLDASTFRDRLEEVYDQVHGSQPLLVFDNHDSDRSWDRYGDRMHDLAIAKVIATIELTSRATVLLYQGQEIGQRTDAPVRREDVQDPIGRIAWPKFKGRDGERTPMQWDASGPQAGFSTNAHTWLPVSKDYPTINVASESRDSLSLLNWYRNLVALRRKYIALNTGRPVFLAPEHQSVLSFARISERGEPIIVAINLAASSQDVDLEASALGKVTRASTLLCASATCVRTVSLARVHLPPFGVWIGRVHR